MIVIGSKKNCLLIEKCRHNGVDNGIGLAGARRSLNICQRIFHGIVNRQKLVQIYPPVQQRQRIILSPDRSVQQIAEKSFQGHCHFVFSVHPENGLIVRVQVQCNVHPQPDDIGHVVHPCDLAAVPHHTVLDLFLVLFKILQQFKFIRIQIPADIFLRLPITVFGADGDIVVRAQKTVLHIQLQLPVRQNIQPPGRVYAQAVHCQLLNGEFPTPPAVLFCLQPGFYLEMSHHFPELLLIKLIALPPETFPVQIMYQRKIRIIGHGIHLAAHLQIIQNLEICGVFE